MSGVGRPGLSALPAAQALRGAPGGWSSPAESGGRQTGKHARTKRGCGCGVARREVRGEDLPASGGRNLLVGMAIFGPWAAVNNQLARDPRFATALAYVAEAVRAGSPVHARIARITAGQTERVELSGGSFALEQVYEPRLRPDGFFESHRTYADVQVIVEGEELMEVEDVSRLVVNQPYLPERDLIKYADTPVASVLRMRAGDIAVFFPEDGHMPSLRWRAAGLVRKTVVKVPVG